MDAVTYVRFVFQNVADRSDIPCIGFFGRCIFINFCELPIFLIVNVTRSRNFLLNQSLRNFPCASTMNCKIENLFNYPLSIRVNSKFVPVLWVPHIAERGSCERALTCCKFRMQCCLNFAAGILGKPFISHPFIKNDCL